MAAIPNIGDEQLTDPIGEPDHALGDLSAPITLVEYGDYECPTCLNAVPIVRAVREALGERVRFVFRHFPQSSIHPHASIAAEAAEAAGDQNKFWEMHAALFAHQKELDSIDLGHLALTLGLEIYKFETSRGMTRHRDHVKADYQSGVRSGVKGTPTFFINGRRYTGPREAGAIVKAAERMGA